MVSGMSGMSGMSMEDMKAQMQSKMFKDVDKDSDSSINETEFETVASKLSEITGKEVDSAELFAEVDADGNGSVDETELSNHVEEYRKGMEGLMQQSKMNMPNIQMSAMMSEDSESGSSVQGMGKPQGPPPGPPPVGMTGTESTDESDEEDTYAMNLAEILSQSGNQSTSIADLFSSYTDNEESYSTSI